MDILDKVEYSDFWNKLSIVGKIVMLRKSKFSDKYYDYNYDELTTSLKIMVRSEYLNSKNIECINYLDRLINDTDDYNIDSYGEDVLNRIKTKLTK